MNDVKQVKGAWGKTTLYCCTIWSNRVASVTHSHPVQNLQWSVLIGPNTRQKGDIVMEMKLIKMKKKKNELEKKILLDI